MVEEIWFNFLGCGRTGSGCIGMKDSTRKYFCKIAGVNTVEADVSPKESVEILKEAVLRLDIDCISFSCCIFRNVPFACIVNDRQNEE